MDSDTYTPADLATTLHETVTFVLPYVGAVVAIVLGPLFALMGIHKAIDWARVLLAKDDGYVEVTDEQDGLQQWLGLEGTSDDWDAYDRYREQGIGHWDAIKYAQNDAALADDAGMSRYDYDD